MTSTVLSTCLLLSAIWFAFITSSSGSTKIIKIIFFIILILLLIAVVVVINPDFFSVKTFFKIIGRNETLTGRTSLWAVGLRGFAERPYLGWGFDTLRSFLGHYSLGYGQLHNGYLDLLVRGGLISLFLLLLMMSQLLKNIIKLKFLGDKRHFFILSLFVAILTHNITEASFVSNIDTLWIMFLILYFYGFSCLYPKKNFTVDHT